MTCLLQRPARQACLAVLLTVGPLAVNSITAGPITFQPVPATNAGRAAGGLPPMPPTTARSPVDLFRNLLAMTPAEQEHYLTNRPPAIRGRIVAKLHEYAAMDPDDRELRLRATELRWYLLPLLHQSPTNRTAQLTGIPPELRSLVKTRLMQWDLLPPPLKNEFFDSERALHYFSQVDPPLPTPEPPGSLDPHTVDLSRWNAMPAEQRQKITDQFNSFFELTPGEKQKTLRTLSAAERQQMEKTLQTFDQLPPGQRQKCIRAFTEFAGMSASEKQDFLKNAQRWSQLSPKERQTWRDLVSHVPVWAPIPANLMPPPRPALTLRVDPALATNRN